MVNCVARQLCYTAVCLALLFVLDSNFEGGLLQGPAMGEGTLLGVRLHGESAVTKKAT